MTYPGPFIYLSQALFDVLQQRGWDMKYYRVNPTMVKAPPVIEHDPQEGKR